MDGEKKSEASGEALEQLGPSQLQEQVPQDEFSQGEIYRATHETSGAMALVLKLAAQKGCVSLNGWRVLLGASASPATSPCKWSRPPGPLLPTGTRWSR